MCVHRRLIYATCGHSTFSPVPLVECRLASFDPVEQWSSGCEISAHPYKTLRFHQLCPPCQNRRNRLIREIDESQAVRFDEWQWKVSYGMPENGKDYWTKKAEEIAMERQQEEEKLRKENKRSKSVKRFIHRKKKSGDPATPTTPRIIGSE